MDGPADSGDGGRLPFRWGAVSAAGKVRYENQDAFLADEERGLFIVSDGMGGQKAGALASKIVVSVLPGMIHARLKKRESSDAVTILSDVQESIVELNHFVRGKGSEHLDLTGMGATLVMAILFGRQALIAHIGDSRVYFLRNGKIELLTEDHTVVAAMVRHGDIKLEEAKAHPDRNRLSRYLGMPSEVRPDVRTVDLEVGDRLLLCSDGLNGMLDDGMIADLLRKRPDPRWACRALVDAANAAGGYDNVTVVLVDT